MRTRLLAGAAILAISGCASTQLNYNTLDLASTVGDIQTQQVLFNLSLFIDNPDALPTHVDLGTGTTSTNNALTPQFGTPFNAATTLFSQATSTLAAAPSTVGTTQKTATTAASTFSLTASDSWTQGWTYSPVTNSNELKRLQTLYAYALGTIHDSGLETEYPKVRKVQQINFASTVSAATSRYCPDLGFTDSQAKATLQASEAQANSDRAQKKAKKSALTTVRDDAKSALKNPHQQVDDATKAVADAQAALEAANSAEKQKAQAALDRANAKLTLAQSDLKNAQDYYATAQKNLDAATADSAAAEKAYSEATKSAKSDASSACSSVVIQAYIPDDQFMHEPNCVICLKNDDNIVAIYRSRKDTHINPRLRALNGGWILTESDSRSDDAKYLGHFGKHDLYIERHNLKKLAAFTLFALMATEESTTPAASSGGSPQTAGSGTSKKSATTTLTPQALSPAVGIVPGGTNFLLVPQ